MRTLPAIFGLVLFAGCMSADKVEFQVGVVGPLLGDTELAALYEEHGFTFPLDEGAKASSTVMILSRNELQQKLLARATEACHEFKVQFASKLKDGNARLAGFSQAANVVGAAATNAPISQGFASIGAALSFMDNRYSKIYETESLNVALSGIERARRRVYLQIDKKLRADLVEYPVARAVNDAYRYHSVCTLLDGLIEAADSVNSEPS